MDPATTQSTSPLTSDFSTTAAGKQATNFSERVPFWVRCLIHFVRPAIPALIGALAPFVAAEKSPSPLAWLIIIGTAAGVGISGFCSYIDDSSDGAPPDQSAIRNLQSAISKVAPLILILIGLFLLTSCDAYRNFAATTTRTYGLSAREYGKDDFGGELSVTFTPAGKKLGMGKRRSSLGGASAATVPVFHSSRPADPPATK